jgi:hypothetical protein
MLSFCHHVIPLLSLPGAAGALGGKVHLPAVKAACKSAERIHGVLTLAGRFELAVVTDTPDFFDPELVNTKARNQAWETIRETQRLQWVIPTRRPDLITSSLPPTWIGKGLQNVCIGYMADSDGDIAKNLQALRNAPLQHRMILLSSSSPPVDLPEHLEGIDWVVFTGNPDDAALAETIGSSCRQSGAAFLFHQSDGRWENESTIGASEDGSPWPTHPFGTKIDLSRPTLPNLMTNQTADSEKPIPSAPEKESTVLPAMRAMKSTGLASEPDSVPEPPAEVLDFEVFATEADHQTPASASPVAVANDAEVQDFTRLDGVVRRGLATFIEVGHALAEIRDRELWRAGGHSSWAEYCGMIGGLSKTHANRIIASARISSHIAEVTPIGVTPGNEAQVRPLTRLKQPDQQVLAWTRAVARANGQPTAGMLTEVVTELMAGESPREASGLSPRQRKLEAFLRLRDAFHAKRPRKEIERFLTELENHLQSP